MKEELSDLIKYRPVVLELRKAFGKKYLVSDSEFRWITIQHNRLFDGSLVAKIYPIDEERYGVIEVYDAKFFEFFKNYGKKRKYPSITKCFNDGDEGYYVEPEFVEVGTVIKDSKKILKLRLSKGEINSEEYTERMSRL